MSPFSILMKGDIQGKKICIISSNQIIVCSSALGEIFAYVNNMPL